MWLEAKAARDICFTQNMSEIQIKIKLMDREGLMERM